MWILWFGNRWSSINGTSNDLYLGCNIWRGFSGVISVKIIQNFSNLFAIPHLCNYCIWWSFLSPLSLSTSFSSQSFLFNENSFRSETSKCHSSQPLKCHRRFSLFFTWQISHHRDVRHHFRLWGIIFMMKNLNEVFFSVKFPYMVVDSDGCILPSVRHALVLFVHLAEIKFLSKYIFLGEEKLSKYVSIGNAWKNIKRRTMKGGCEEDIVIFLWVLDWISRYCKIGK